jgi:hypothetical protein
MRNPVNVRRIAMLAVAPLLLVGLVACGSGDDTSSADASSTPSESPSTSGTAASTPTESSSGDSTAGQEIDPQEFVDRISSTFSKATTAQISMNVTTTGLAMAATGQVDYTGDTPAMALKMTAPSLGEGTIDMRLIDRVMYMSMPMLDPSGKFFKIDLSDPKNPLGASVGDLGTFDPQSTLEMFSKGVKSVKLMGDETIDGDATTHYQVTTVTKYLASELGGATTGTDLPDEFTYDIWLDSNDRLRKMTADVGKQTSIEMEMTNWGEPVDIKVPPASQVQEMPGS